MIPILLAAIATGALGPQLAAAAGRKDCGLIGSRSWGGLWLTRNHVERVRLIRGTSCRTAKRIARAFNRSPGVVQPDGWSCFNGHRPQPFLFDCGKGLSGQQFRHYFKVFPTYRLWHAQWRRTAATR